MHWNASQRILLQSCKNAEVESWLEAIVAAVAGCWDDFGPGQSSNTLLKEMGRHGDAIRCLSTVHAEHSGQLVWYEHSQHTLDMV